MARVYLDQSGSYAFNLSLAPDPTAGCHLIPRHGDGGTSTHVAPEASTPARALRQNWVHGEGFLSTPGRSHLQRRPPNKSPSNTGDPHPARTQPFLGSTAKSPIDGGGFNLPPNPATGVLPATTQSFQERHRPPTTSRGHGRRWQHTLHSVLSSSLRPWRRGGFLRGIGLGI
jgi:hypothetical protein